MRRQHLFAVELEIRIGPLTVRCSSVRTVVCLHLYRTNFESFFPVYPPYWNRMRAFQEVETPAWHAEYSEVADYYYSTVVLLLCVAECSRLLLM